jgi:hypothetical protein
MWEGGGLRTAEGSRALMGLGGQYCAEEVVGEALME